MKHKRGEGARILGTAAFALNLKSQSDINNYALADNKTLTQNKKLLSTYTEFKQDWPFPENRSLNTQRHSRMLSDIKKSSYK